MPMRAKVITVSKNLSVDELIHFIQTTNKFSCEIHLKSDHFKIDAKSLMGVITVVRKGCEMILLTKGEDEEIALKEVSSLL